MTTNEQHPATSQPGEVGSSASLGLAASAPKPRAWAIFVDSGNARMWTTLQPHVQKLADAEGLEVTPLYDRAEVDAAVAAEREKQACLEKALRMWMHLHESPAGYEGKYGKALTEAINAQQARIDAAAAASRTALDAASSGA